MLALVATSLVLRAIVPQPSLAVTPSAAVKEFPVNTYGSDPLGVATGPDGNLWIADSNDFDPKKIENMTTSGVVAAFPFPSFDGCCVDPASIVAGPDNNMWFTELTMGANSIGRITTGGAISEWSIPTKNSIPMGITVGPENNLWFTEAHPGGNIGRITTSGAITEFPITTTGNTPFGITKGADGNIWFTEQSSDTTPTKIGVMDTGGHMLTEITVSPTGKGICSIIAVGSRIWFTEQTGNAIGWIDSATKTFDAGRQLVYDGTSGPTAITYNPADGYLYFIEPNGNSIGRFDAANPPGSVAIHDVVPTAGAFSGGTPQGIAVGPDGNIWFAEGSPKAEGSNPSPVHALGRLTLGSTATPSPAADLSPTSVDFGSQTVGTTGGAQQITLRNPGTAALSVSQVSVTGGNAGDFTPAADSCSGTSVPAGGGSCTVSVAFSPRTAGALAAALTFSDSAPNGTQSVALAGQGVAPASTGPDPAPVPSNPPPVPSNPPPPAPPSGGYWLSSTDGGIFNFGSAGFLGSTGAIRLNKPIVGMAATPSGHGYWLVASDGGIFNFGDAGFFGSTGAIRLNKPIVGMAATPSGQGYWLVATDGGIFNYGDAAFFGSTGAIRLNKPIVAMAPTRSGQGYWLSASDGGIFNYGDAAFFGSTGAINLNKPIVAMAPAPDGGGYWLVATDGGIFNFGTARFAGSTGAIHLNSSIVGMASTSDGHGYWLAAADGGIFNFGTAGFFGSAGAARPNSPIVVMVAAS